jgi:hypothetical protein
MTVLLVVETKESTSTELVKFNFLFLNNSGNGCYHSVQNLLSSRLLSKNVKIKIYKTIILPVLLYWCETLSLTLQEVHRLKVFQDKVLRIFGHKSDEIIGGWRKLHTS